MCSAGSVHQLGNLGVRRSLERNSPLKRCRVCGRLKPRTREYFHRQRDTADGFTNRCKECVYEYQTRRYSDGRRRKSRRRKQAVWQKAHRRAQREEYEQKVSRFLMDLQRNGVEIIERRTAKNGRTTLVRIVYPSGELRTIYFSWKGAAKCRKEVDGQSQAEKALASSLAKGNRKQEVL